jgi:hypothetical protein
MLCIKDGTFNGVMYVFMPLVQSSIIVWERHYNSMSYMFIYSINLVGKMASLGESWKGKIYNKPSTTI